MRRKRQSTNSLPDCWASQVYLHQANTTKEDLKTRRKTLTKHVNAHLTYENTCDLRLVLLTICPISSTTQQTGHKMWSNHTRSAQMKQPDETVRAFRNNDYLMPLMLKIWHQLVGTLRTNIFN